MNANFLSESTMELRPITDVAVGILMRAGVGGREFLLTTRPTGKVYADYWEFPGGKFELGETVEQALKRELQEELGIRIASCLVWREQMFDYPHARVRLHFCQVFAWSGEIQMCEGQQMQWCTLPVAVSPVLPGTLPVLEWFAQDWGYQGALTVSEESL